MFVPVRIALGAGGQQRVEYDRSIEMTERQFLALEQESRDMTEPLTKIGTDLHAQIAAAFATEGATGFSGPWAPLSEAYGEWKAQRSAAPILVGLKPTHKGTRQSPTRPQTYVPSGQMRAQMLEPLAMHITPRRLLYAPTSDIAGFHETGTPDMPARPPVDVTINFLHSVDRAFVQWVAMLTDRMGLTGPGSRPR